MICPAAHGDGMATISTVSQWLCASPQRGVTQTVASALISSPMDSNSIARNSCARQRQSVVT
uniref:Uncharacterized protein n=1 Tax=Ackermannviridae sp. TaxID=2831612 RepID=A0A8S5VK67_9CAUD|nr:MAG TPA: hypothetical protein [Ackermannviridae sp.]